MVVSPVLYHRLRSGAVVAITNLKQRRIMKNIFVNMESGDGVMIFTENEKITPEVVMAALLECGREVIEA